MPFARFKETESKVRTSLFVAATALSSVLGCTEPERPEVRPPSPPPVVQEAPRSAAPTDAVLEPPALAGDSNDCVIRRFDRDTNAWQTTTFAFDEASRVLQGPGGPLRFDEHGRLSSRGQAQPGFDQHAFSYDEHGNITEHTVMQDEQLRQGTRWRNTYAKARLTGVTAGELTQPKQREKVHTRVTFGYDDAGRVSVENADIPMGARTRSFKWIDGRLDTIELTRKSRQGGARLAYDAVEKFSYDEQGRLKTYERDGGAYGEVEAADGAVDVRRSYRYDDAGRLVRAERDGNLSDIGPSKPDGEPEEVSLFSPRCDAAGRLHPELLELPDTMLPASLAPRFR